MARSEWWCVEVFEHSKAWILLGVRNLGYLSFTETILAVGGSYIYMTTVTLPEVFIVLLVLWSFEPFFLFRSPCFLSLLPVLQARFLLLPFSLFL